MPFPDPNREFYVDSYGGVYGAMVVMPVGRLAMPHLTRPSTKYKPRYQAICLFDRSDADAIRGLEIACADIVPIVTKQWGNADPEMIATAIKNGDERDYQGFAGCSYIQAASDLEHRPTFVGPDTKPIDPAQIQAGMKVRLVVTPHTYDTNGGGVSWQLNTVMLVEDDGVRYSGGPDPIALLKALAPVETAPAVPATEQASAAGATTRTGRTASRGRSAALNNL